MYSPGVGSSRPEHAPILGSDVRLIDSARRIGTMVVLLVLLAAFLTPLVLWGWVGGLARWAADNFQFAFELRAAVLEGRTHVAVRPIPNFYHLDQLRPAGPSWWWVNWAVAGYYGFAEVHVDAMPDIAP
jgi:hypothetical protein